MDPPTSRSRRTRRFRPAPLRPNRDLQLSSIAAPSCRWWSRRFQLVQRAAPPRGTKAPQPQQRDLDVAGVQLPSDRRSRSAASASFQRHATPSIDPARSRRDRKYGASPKTYSIGPVGWSGAPVRRERAAPCPPSGSTVVAARAAPEAVAEPLARLSQVEPLQDLLLQLGEPAAWPRAARATASRPGRPSTPPFADHFRGVPDDAAGAHRRALASGSSSPRPSGSSPSWRSRSWSGSTWLRRASGLRQRLLEQRGRHDGGTAGWARAAPRRTGAPDPPDRDQGRQCSRRSRCAGARGRAALPRPAIRRDAGHPPHRGRRCGGCGLRAREGALDELDVETTIDKTARNAGELEISLRPPRRRRICASSCSST